ncbi:MAG: proprotein convertase P-domain-containing protein [Deltaproteobacteria bacterium]|nr:proprotein convertase P-domain-containing protein [Deltaproteobacteria bacterium]
MPVVEPGALVRSLWKVPFRRMAPSVSLVALAACGAPAVDEPLGKVESAEKIDAENDPTRFSLTMNRKAAELPNHGESLRKPFPSNWWPMARQGAAQRWQGSSSSSPVEKYDLLVSPSAIRDVELKLAQKNHKDEPVNADAQPETFHVGPAGEWELKSHGRYGTRDPENWYGHCNGWSSYVLSEDEPTRSVSVKYDATSNRITECPASDSTCVRFDVGDINALGSEIYWSDGARVLGRRCEDNASEFAFDESGRPTNVNCRDGNAGTFHIVVTNMIGTLQRPFVVDLTADREVWNFPMYKFEVTQNKEIPLAEALRDIGAPAGTSSWTYNPDAKRFLRIHLDAWIVEDSVPPTNTPTGPMLDQYTTVEGYDYVLELDANGTIVGGEWTGESKTKHPDFLWYPYVNDTTNSDDKNDRDNPALRYSIFKQILTLAQSAPAAPQGVLRVAKNQVFDIPDGSSTGVTSGLEVAESFPAEKVVVRVDVAHTYRGDLKVILRHGSKEVTLADHEGGSADDLHLEAEVAGLAGADVRGAWSLVVIDDAAQDTGKLLSWWLDLTRPAGGPGGPTAPVHYGLTPNLAIPDNQPTGLTSDLAIGDDFVPSSVKLTLELTHSYVGDLVVTLEHSGKSVTVHDRAGGSADDLRKTYDLTDFTSTVRGTWTLRVKDLAKDDVGKLVSWALDLAPSGAPAGGSSSVTKEFEVRPAAAIPDANEAGVVATLEVADAIRIDRLEVDLDIVHTYAGDLTVVVEKDGQQEVLHDRANGSNDNVRGVFQTHVFKNASSKGSWKLRVVDHDRQDTGRIERVKLIVVGVL